MTTDSLPIPSSHRVVRRSARRLGLVSHSVIAFAALSFTAFPANQSQAQDAPVQLPPVNVEGQAPTPTNTLQAPVGVDRIPGTIQDTPQTINVITQEQMRDQGVTTLEQALRNVPGISVAIGEGGGGMNGDQFRIRGLEAKGDVYSDGLREFGNYTRDSFNMEEVQVLKGPSALTFGRGTSGGAIVSNSKTPTLEEFGTVSGSIGNGLFLRSTLDYNMPVGEHTAVRFNGMVQDANSASRDSVENNRWAVAPSIGFGLGTDTTFTLAYLHQEWNNVPDYGVPTVVAPGATKAKPTTEFGVDPKKWYGSVTDSDDGSVNVFTGRFSQKVNDWLEIYNDTRVGFYDRYYTPTAISCGAPNSCQANFFSANPASAFGTRGGPGPYDQEGWGAQNITTGIARFNAGGMKNEAVAGLDASYEYDNRTQYAYFPARPLVNILNPSSANSNNYGIDASGAVNASKETDNSNIGIFASDRLWFTPEWSAVAGVRVDFFSANYKAWGPTTPVTELESNSTLVNPRASLIWEPTNQQTYYVSYAQSARPPGEFAAQAPTPLATGTDALDPEVHTSYEIGAKVGFLDGRLGFQGSIFQIDKSNAKETDPATGLVISSGDEQRIRGFELGVTGAITREWNVTANYTYLDSETTDSATAANIGQPVQFVPKNSASLWTTYALFSNVTLGTGLTYTDTQPLNAANTGEVPSAITVDAMAAYQLGNVRFALNVYNVFEELRYTQLWNNRAIPDKERLFIFTTSYDF